MKSKTLRRGKQRNKCGRRELTCVGCGCTEERACPGGCDWVFTDADRLVGLCTSCLSILKELGPGARKLVALQMYGEGNDEPF